MRPSDPLPLQKVLRKKKGSHTFPEPLAGQEPWTAPSVKSGEMDSRGQPVLPSGLGTGLPQPRCVSLGPTHPRKVRAVPGCHSHHQAQTPQDGVYWGSERESHLPKVTQRAGGGV